MKQMKSKNDKNSGKQEEQQDEKVGQVDEIKKRYGFSSSVSTHPFACMSSTNEYFAYHSNCTTKQCIHLDVVGFYCSAGIKRC